MTPREQRAATGSATPHHDGKLTTTFWPTVIAAGSEDSEVGRAALEQLCRKYWPALYAFVRKQGIARADAEDLVQGFFADFLSRKAIARADASRGRFRTFLLSSFRNFQMGQGRSRSALKRGGGVGFISLDVIQSLEGTLGADLAADETPESIYDRRWTEQVLSQAFATVRREYASVGKSALFDQLRAALWGGRGACSYAEIARRTGKSEGAIKLAIFRLKKQLRAELLRFVGETVERPESVETELRHLLVSVSA